MKHQTFNNLHQKQHQQNQPNHAQLQQLQVKHPHHPHFVAGIGDGKHHDYDLPDLSSSSSSHSFIRKKRDNLMQEFNRHQHQQMDGVYEHNNNQRRGPNDRNIESEKNAERSEHNKSGDGKKQEDELLNVDHIQRHYKKQQHHKRANANLQKADLRNQKSHNIYHDNSNHGGGNPNTNLNKDDQLLDYSIHGHEHGVLVYSSFLTILGILSTLVAISWIIKSSDYLSELLSKFNIHIGHNNKLNHNTKAKNIMIERDNFKGHTKKKDHHNAYYKNLFTAPFHNLQRKIKNKLKLRRVNSSIIRTKKKKTDEWNSDDDDDEVGSYENQHQRNEVDNERNTVVDFNNNVNMNINPASSYSHHSHHGFYRHEMARLRKHAANVAASTTANTSSATTTNNNVSNANINNATTTQAQSLFPSSTCNDYSQSPECNKPRKRYNIHQHQVQHNHNNDENIVDIGAGLDGFDIAMSDSESIYTTTSDVISNAHNQSSPYNNSNMPSFQQNNTMYHRQGTTNNNTNYNIESNSISTIDSVSDEEWDRVLRRERSNSHLSNSPSSHTATKTLYNDNNNKNEGQYSPSQRILETLSTSHDYYATPMESNCEEYAQQQYTSSGPKSDEEMPTPRIENVQQIKPVLMEVKPNNAYIPTSSSYSSPRVAELPQLPSLSIESCPTGEEGGEDYEEILFGDRNNISKKNEEQPFQSVNQCAQTPPSKDVESSNPHHSFKSSFPQSISVEELKLIRMETGMVGAAAKAQWETSINATQDSYHRNNASMSSTQIFYTNIGRENNAGQNDTYTSNGKADIYMIEEGQRFIEKNEKAELQTHALREEDDGGENDLSDGETEGANGIFHKRKDLTSCSDAASSLTSPISFAELKMKELIGGGGFGQVWSATWRGTPVAVKVLAVSHKAENVQRAILQEFAAEINMVSGMRHPNVCLYIGACLEPSNRAIVTELAANGSLWDALRTPLKPPYFVADGKTRNAWPLHLYQTASVPVDLEISTIPEFGAPVPFGTSPYIPLAPEGSWPWFLVRKIAEGAARGMNYLHFGNPPVLHRDLKSANILLDDSYNAKVADFGLSRLKAQERSMTGNCGTVQWMAPEILANNGYAEPADVYSYGIILWELLVRDCPYGDMSPIQCALAVLNKDSRPEIPEWCPPAFKDLILRCMEKDPSNRPTFAEIITILDALK